MAQSIEARVPFLDSPLVDFSLRFQPLDENMTHAATRISRLFAELFHVASLAHQQVTFLRPPRARAAS
jgi:asparagine synthetase B (glutamine-hydrolysing)